MIPDFQTIMLPFLKYFGDKKEHSILELREKLVIEFNLSKEERTQFLSSGGQTIFNNRVGWARTYLKKAGLLEYIRKGYFRITERGLELLKNPPDKINTKFLKQYPGFLEFIKSTKIVDTDVTKYIEKILEVKTPEDLIEAGYQKIDKGLVSDLLEHIKKCTPGFFESLVVELLVKMGYGGSIEDAGKVIGRIGDEGVDGIIKEDKLGLDVIYLQAKKWEGPVSRAEVQKFAGALLGKKAKKGVFITTSGFSKSTYEFVSKIENKIVLIDGEQLAHLMIEYGIGVSKISSYEIKKLNSNYFPEE